MSKFLSNWYLCCDFQMSVAVIRVFVVKTVTAGMMFWITGVNVNPDIQADIVIQVMQGACSNVVF